MSEVTGSITSDSGPLDLGDLIKRAHKNPSDDSLQQEAIQASVNYIHSHDDELHLFCNKDMHAASIHALILFSFSEDDNQALDWLKEKIARSLDACPRCVSLFHRGRVKLKETFVTERGVDAESVEIFSEMILRWEAERLFQNFTEQTEAYEKSKERDPQAPVSTDLLKSLAECLCGPGMLRLVPDLRICFDKLLHLLLKNEHPFTRTATAINPGYIFLAFEGDDTEKRWAFKMLDQLASPELEPLRSNQIHHDILEEYEVQLRYVQKDHNVSVDDLQREKFYRGIYPLFKIFDPTAIIEKVAHFAKLRPVDVEEPEQLTLSIFYLLRNDIMLYPDQSLPYVLRLLTLLLIRVGSKFWGEIGEFTFQNIMGCILRNPSFIKGLCMLPNSSPMKGELNAPGRILDLLDWIDPFLETLNLSQKLKSIENISLQLIGVIETQESVPLNIKALLFSKSCELICDGLTIPSPLYTPSLTVDLLNRSDTRVIVNNKLVRFFDYGTAAAIFFPEDMREKNAEIVRTAIQVICKAMRFDILTFAQNSYEINRGKSPSTLKFSSQLFKGILKQNLPHHLELSYQLLCSMENVSTILPVGSKAHTSEVKEFLGLLNNFLIKIGDVNVSQTKKILSNSKSLKGYWACVFSPDENVYQSAIDILYETFDAAGRLEGVQALLSNNIEACIQAINDNLSNLIFIEFFEPCPRAVRVLSDVIQALNSPVDGLFAEHETFTKPTRKALVMFWNRCWKFLDLIYIKTLVWADKYPDLVEFTRDTLDLSHAVLGCFKTIKDVFEEGDLISVFNEITNTFEHMLVWLRLSDAGLLASCVKLIFYTVDLATELNYKLSPKVIDLLARYGARAKKFNNKLTDAQSEEILERARIFDSDLVDSIVQETNALRKPKQNIKEESPKFQSISSRSTPSSDVHLSSSTLPRMRGQMKVDNFASLSRVAAVAPNTKPQFPKSQLELAREKLNAKKLSISAQKSRKDTRNDDDNDSDEETSDAYSLFNLRKPAREKTGIILLDDYSKPKRKAADEKKKEEEYSRLRLNVDMKPLYRKVLKWSFLRESDYPDDELSNLKPVPDSFKSAEDYVKIYEPLLLVECWQAICAARAREDFKPLTINVGAKSTVDDFFEVFCSLTKTETAEKNITDSDLVVIALAENVRENPRVKDVKNSKVSCLAKVHEIKHLKGDRVDLTLRVTRSASLHWLSPQTPIAMMRIMQMITVEREFSSLFGLKYYNLADQILRAKPSAPAEVLPSEIESIQQTYKVNDSQAIAIRSSVNTEGFSLIQGPPGTGKTKTILGVIGYMLSTFRASNAIAIPQGQLSKSDVTKIKKVLVCAPSNAAVDELVLRLKDGIMNSKGQKYVPKLVRLGRSDVVNPAVKDATLEELVDAQLGKTGPIANITDGLFKELNALKAKVDECKKEIDDSKKEPSEELYKKKRALISQINQVKKKLDQEREAQNSAYRNREITRRNCQAKILGEAEIICSTLSGSAHDMVANLGIKFDSVIIDEACQCTELSAVIPLRYGCRRCIMVGDPNQLPPTVLSNTAAGCKYDQSLFVRMAKNVKPLLLNIQYRMNSAISKFPSKKFYDGELKDGPENDSLTEREWHKDMLLAPYKFYDIVEGQQTQNKKTFSYTNKVEVDIAMELVHKLFKDFKNLNFRNKIGVITPYKEQNQLLKSSFIKEFGKSVLSEISFNTIDGFQGQEKEIIIMSCVRADASSNGVGFLKDFRRMNVALTRPKCSLWILGHHDSLIKNNLWRDLIQDARDRSCLMEARRGFTNERGFSGGNNHRKNGPSKIKSERYVPRPPESEKENDSELKATYKPASDPKPSSHSRRLTPPAANLTPVRQHKLSGSAPEPIAHRSGSLPPRYQTSEDTDLSTSRAETVPSVPSAPSLKPAPKDPASSTRAGPATSATSSGGDQPIKPSSSGVLKPRPEAPLRKRPPKGPPSIFIPKKRKR